MNKQDEGKAKSLWYNWCQATTCHGIINCVDCPHAHVHPQFLEMAQWKEEKLVEKVENFLRGIYLPYYANNSHIDRDNNELINDIKKAILKEE